MTITLKDTDGATGMRVAGRLASEVLDYLTPFVKPGVTTNELDKLAHDYMVQVQGTIPAPLNYQPPGYSPYPKSICTSINHQVCHGIPNDKVLKKGDIVNIDITVIKDGWHGDTSRMFIVGDASIAAKRLCAVTYEAMWHGIEQVKPGAPRWALVPDHWQCFWQCETTGFAFLACTYPLMQTSRSWLSFHKIRSSRASS